MKKLMIIGASGHGKVVADIAEKNEYEKIGFLDDNTSLKECVGFPVVGKSSDVDKYKDWEFVVAIGNATVRQQLQNRLERQNYKIAILIHPRAVIGLGVEIGAGTVVMAGVVVNSGTSIGKGCIINTCGSVDHDCVIGDYVHISVGAHLAGTVHVGQSTWVGIGAVISNNIGICDRCMIGAGAVVISNIIEKGIYVGVPAKRVHK